MKNKLEEKHFFVEDDNPMVDTFTIKEISL